MASPDDDRAGPEIHLVRKPNQIGAHADLGEMQPSATGWNTATPVSDNTVHLDPYSPKMIGGDPLQSWDHNSQWINETPIRG